MAAPPDRVGRYEILAKIATGGMAELFLGRVSGPGGFERPVVIKRILPHLTEDATFVSMFLDEARLSSQVQHPNVVQVFELGQDGGDLFLTMEYLQGESLAAVVRRARESGKILPLTLVAKVVSDACAGLQAVHDIRDKSGALQDVVHRDVSPQNLFVCYSGDLKVIDLGIAKANDRFARTTTGQLKGKYEYMSPEQCRGEELDRRSDVFSLGVVLYELAVGERLFKRASELLVFEAITREPLPQPSARAPGFPADLERIILRSLARRRDDRYESAAAMRQDLEAWLRGTGASVDAQTELAALMQELFADRIALKQDVLRAGPASLAVDAKKPARDDVTVTDQSLPAKAAEPKRRASARAAVFVASLALLAGGLAAWSIFVGRAGSVSSASPPRVSATAVNEAPPSSASAQPSAATSAPLHVESAPSSSVESGGPPKGPTRPRPAPSTAPANAAPMATSAPPAASTDEFHRFH